MHDPIARTPSEYGFTLIELLVTMGLVSVVLTLSAFAFRQFWYVQALEGARDEVVSQLRQRQEQAVSESHPLVFAARFNEGTSEWALVEYSPDDPATVANEQSCIEVETLRFSSGVRLADVAVASSPEATWCAGNLLYAGALGGGAVPGRETSEYVMFYPRGTATSATITLNRPTVNHTRTVEVLPITGRVNAT